MASDADGPGPGDDRPNLRGRSDVSSEMYAFAADETPPGSSVGAVRRRADGARPAARSHDLLAHAPVDDFESLFAAHYDRLVRALSLVAGDPETAADAVQEAFVKAHLRWRKVSSYDDPIAWVRRVAINHIHDGHRRRVRKDRALLRLASRERAATIPVEIDEFDRLLASLPKQQRAATALYYVDGLSVTEIAAALDLAEGSVKSHLHDARRRLRPVLEREAAAEGRGAAPGPSPTPDVGPTASPTTTPNASDWERP